MKNKVYILSQGEHIEQEDELIDKRRRSPLVKKWQVLNCLLFFEKRIICNHRWIVKYIVMCSVNQTSLQVLLNHNIFFLSWILSLTSKCLTRFLDTLKDFPQGSHLQCFKKPLLQISPYFQNSNHLKNQRKLIAQRNPQNGAIIFF